MGLKMATRSSSGPNRIGLHTASGKLLLKGCLIGKGVLPELLDLFDPACNKDATPYNIAITDDDFARYDREDQHGNKISLNEQQREAFTKLLNYGPLSLLQGPPGTGKTEFIAAFVHFLVEKLECAKNPAGQPVSRSGQYVLPNG